MKMKPDEYSFFMTKPFPPIDNPQIEGEVIHTLENHLIVTGGFHITKRPYRIVPPKEKFWREFYAHVPGEILEPMIVDLIDHLGRPLIIFYSGGRIAQRIIDKLGPTKYSDNQGMDTIRGLYKIPSDPDWKNIAHAPKPEEVETQINLLRKYRLA